MLAYPAHLLAEESLRAAAAAAAVLRGMDVVYKVEKTGSTTGQPSATVKISDSGELPLLRHLGGKNVSVSAVEDEAAGTAEDMEEQLQ